mmetsp:Transcript_69792/g.179999  ORF Transcript_69792/g.179999 Transcript_69792/m.179999 type:complete len:286 (+) Transcript_69792:1602-2459(+)
MPTGSSTRLTLTDWCSTACTVSMRCLGDPCSPRTLAAWAATSTRRSSSTTSRRTSCCSPTTVSSSTPGTMIRRTRLSSSSRRSWRSSSRPRQSSLISWTSTATRSRSGPASGRAWSRLAAAPTLTQVWAVATRSTTQPHRCTGRRSLRTSTTSSRRRARTPTMADLTRYSRWAPTRWRRRSQAPHQTSTRPTWDRHRTGASPFRRRRARSRFRARATCRRRRRRPSRRVSPGRARPGRARPDLTRSRILRSHSLWQHSHARPSAVPRGPTKHRCRSSGGESELAT